ncbi:MAG: hypothetical protein J7501_01415 [Bdellovibrio sp.]|nr:hypothetical protein [Bdellovibrio sp.]
MKNTLFILAIVLQAGFSQAKTTLSTPVNQEPSSYEVDSNIVTSIIEEDADAEEVAMITQGLKFSRECKKFAFDSNYGAWGKSVTKLLGSKRYPNLIKGSSDLRKYCQNYNTMSYEDKESIWVLIIASMAHLESSCNQTPARQPSGPNGQLVGTLQLHKGQEGRYAKDELCKNGSGNTAGGSFLCGMSMLDRQMERYDSLFWNESYWAVLRPNSNDRVKDPQGRLIKPSSVIKLAIAKYPACGNKTSKSKSK